MFHFIKFPSCFLKFPSCSMKLPLCSLKFLSCSMNFHLCSIKFHKFHIKFHEVPKKFNKVTIISNEVLNIETWLILWNWTLSQKASQYRNNSRNSKVQFPCESVSAWASENWVHTYVHTYTLDLTWLELIWLGLIWLNLASLDSTWLQRTTLLSKFFSASNGLIDNEGGTHNELLW